VGIAEYREVHYKPYRIIYRIHARTVIVYCVLDGRRDMQTLLQHRLLR
jgi:toxin ParE1/3/4